jgi:hypothetical protein
MLMPGAMAATDRNCELTKKTFICLSNLKFGVIFLFKVFILLLPGLCHSGRLHHLTVPESK